MITPAVWRAQGSSAYWTLDWQRRGEWMANEAGAGDWGPWSSVALKSFIRQHQRPTPAFQCLIWMEKTRERERESGWMEWGAGRLM